MMPPSRRRRRPSDDSRSPAQPAADAAAAGEADCEHDDDDDDDDGRWLITDTVFLLACCNDLRRARLSPIRLHYYTTRKPEVHNVSRRRQSRTEPQPRAPLLILTYTKMVKFGHVVLSHMTYTHHDRLFRSNKPPQVRQH